MPFELQSRNRTATVRGYQQNYLLGCDGEGFGAFLPYCRRRSYCCCLDGESVRQVRPSFGTGRVDPTRGGLASWGTRPRRRGNCRKKVSPMDAARRLTAMPVPTPFAPPWDTAARWVAWFQVQIGTYAAFRATGDSTGS